MQHLRPGDLLVDRFGGTHRVQLVRLSCLRDAFSLRRAFRVSDPDRARSEQMCGLRLTGSDSLQVLLGYSPNRGDPHRPLAVRAALHDAPEVRHGNGGCPPYLRLCAPPVFPGNQGYVRQCAEVARRGVLQVSCVAFFGAHLHVQGHCCLLPDAVMPRLP